jgi:hypothetical protein
MFLFLFFGLFLYRLLASAAVTEAGIGNGANTPGKYKNYQDFLHIEWFYI